MYILNRIGCKRSVKVSDIVTIDRNNFEYAENDFNPICLLNKNWEDIKLDLIDTISTLNKD